MISATGDGKESQHSTASSSIESSQRCRVFKFPEILLATDNFNESLAIGKGGFGNVYKGNINGSNSPVAAIKRLDPMSSQRESEFLAEVEMLSNIRHRHVVSLFGYCKYEEEMILVYEYMPNGSLEDHLHKLGTPLSWLQRLKICIGAARGLDYLHTGTGIKVGVIHRDVKSSNILLEESWTAKISDFSLSKTIPTNQTDISTLVKGTFGYLDPDYFYTGMLTRKSDVYAFGVVLLEVLCRKRALDISLGEESLQLAEWAQESIKKGKSKNIIDSSIGGEISSKCLKEFVGIVEGCLLRDPNKRPMMADVVVGLSSVLALQEKTKTSRQAGRKTIFGNMLDMLPSRSNQGNFGISSSHESVEGPLSSSSIARHTYDVFLSFGGCDTRDNFIDHLNKALVDADITTFMDDEMVKTKKDLKSKVESVIKTGKDLKLEPESAIKESRASIIVFSKNYANSPRRLDELVLILEQRMTSNHIVIPIFYHVEPTHVWKQQSTFGLAMAEYKHRMEAETNAIKRSELAQKIDQWNKALAEVANLNGKDVNGRRETEFIEEIVKDIYRGLHVPLRRALPLLIGMDSAIKFVTSWLNDASSHTADVLTIFGMGGIGKTSLAKYVYGLHFHEFDTSNFIEDISRRCDEKFNGLLGLQKQLYDISKPSLIPVYDAPIYTSMIRDAVAHKTELLVLDDIGSLFELDTLLGNKGLHPGSKLIITTTDGQLTERCALFHKNVKPKHAKLLLDGLDETESRKFLCFHAFMCNDPKEGYEDVSKKLVKYCEGHPAALEMFGKSLHNRDVAYWNKYIAKLKKEIDPRVYRVLRKSFDSLPYRNDKELFKHIACFFVGMDRDITETISRACGLNTSDAFTNLVDRCLLSVEGNNKLVMHRLLQEMGRFLVCEESPDKPWERSRLWCHEESLKVLRRKKGKGNVLGLTLDMKMLENAKLGEEFELKTDALNEMDNLMLLQLNYVNIKGSYNNFPKELRWLCMHGFPLKSIPSELPMENLAALDLSYSKIKSFSICYCNQQGPQNSQKLSGSSSNDRRWLGSLKILNLSFCEELHSLCGFDGLPALERLIVANCSGLLEVCESIEACVELVFIDLSYCNKLEKLPQAIGRLTKVETLLLKRL